MSSQNPGEANSITTAAAELGALDRGALKFRRVGTFALLWSIAAWLEWFLIPVLFPRSGGPVPHIAFVPQAVPLMLGSVATSVAIPIIAIIARRWTLLLYAAPAIAYVSYQTLRVS
jgi:hypothetical protein